MHTRARTALFLVFAASAPCFPSWDLAAWRTAAPPAERLDRLREETASERNQPLHVLYGRARAEENLVSHGRPEIEWAAWRLAHLHRLADDPGAARAAAAILAGLAARDLPEPPHRKHVEGKWIPFPAVIAYGLLREADIWPVRIGEGLSLAERERIEDWLNSYAASFRALLERPDQLTNYTPFGLRHAAALALVLDDPVVMTTCLDTAMTLAFSPGFWHADHIWQEGTVSYAQQVGGNLKALLPMLRRGRAAGWIDPDGEALARLEKRLETIEEAQIRFSMPSGRPVPVHDTHWKIPADSLPRAPRALAYPDFGHFALPGGDMELHLSIPPLTGGGRYGGGHYHDSRLALQLWAHGQEVLPDAGYPFYPANHRYFHMSPYAHNTAIALDGNAAYAKGPYGVWEGQWARSSLLGYDDGSASNGQVGYVAASSPGPVPDKVDESARQLVQVRTGDWSGYVVDAFWLRGGGLHRWFLRQTEDEPALQDIDAPLEGDGPTLAHRLGEPLEGDKAWTAKLLSPRRIGSDGAFQVTWTGRDSGVAVRVHVAPQPGSVSWSSQMPRVRPTLQDPAKRDDFPGWHLFRQREVSERDLTLWAAVYEPVARGAVPRIQKVDWTRAPDGSGLAVEVTLSDRTDVWVLRLPGTSAGAVGDHVLSGNAAGYAERDGRILWSWAAAGSRLVKGGVIRADGGGATVLPVLSLEPGDTGARLRVGGEAEAAPGAWALLRFADGSGRGLPLGPVLSRAPDGTVFHLETDPGLRVDGRGMRRIAFPAHSVSGPVDFSPLGGRFTRYDPGEKKP